MFKAEVDREKGRAPTIGRVVVYHVGRDGRDRPAMITGIYGEPWDMVDLAVFRRPGDLLTEAEERKPLGPVVLKARVRMGAESGCWAWPVLVA